MKLDVYDSAIGRFLPLIFSLSLTFYSYLVSDLGIIEAFFLTLFIMQKIDAFIHDSEHAYDTMTFENNAIWDHLNQGGLLLSDDVHWYNAFCAFIKNHIPKKIVIFYRLGGVIK